MVRKIKPKFVLTIFLLIFLSSVSGFSGSGSGTADNPYHISNLEDLDQVREDLSANYMLVSDIDASPTEEWNYNETSGEYMGWDPIGDSSQDSQFKGGFDGNGHKIENLFINRPSEDYVGLFGYANNSDIENIGVTKVDVTGNSHVSSLVGTNYGNITRSYSTGEVSSEYYGGGLVGTNRENVSKSYAITDVYGNTYIGGLAGYSNGVIIESYSAGHSDIGGLTASTGFSTENNIGYSYWDVNSSDQEDSAGAPNEELSYLGLNTSEMKDRSNLEGFDFENTWEFVENRNNGYPVLQAFNLNPSTPPDIAVSWNDNSENEEGFRLYSNASGEFKQIGNTAANNEGFVHPLPEQSVGRYICYRITAYNEFGESEPAEGCITP